MTTFVLDNTARDADFAPETVGGLIAHVDATLPDGRIVTAVRIGGVDEPAFRDPLVLARPLAGVEIVIESGTPHDLAARCLGEAAAALDGLAAALGPVASRLRAGDIVAGNQGLADITQAIGTAVTITAAASLGLDEASTWKTELQQAVRALGGGLETLISAQQRQDWLAIAAILDHELVPALRSWREVCSSCC
jgi:hypothetical protein